MKNYFLKKDRYEELNDHKEKRVYNFHKIASKLVEYGFDCRRKENDSLIHFKAYDIDKNTDLSVVIKTRLLFDKKYLNKEIFIAFYDHDNKDCYIYNHDDLVNKLSEGKSLLDTESWKVNGLYHTASWNKYLERFSDIIIKL